MAVQPRCEFDVDNQTITLRMIDPSTGFTDTTFGQIIIRVSDLKDLGDPTGTVRIASFQWLYFKDTGCNFFRAKVLMTPPEPDPTQGGTVTPPAGGGG